MAKYHKPRCGSTGYSPRVRAKKQTPSVNNFIANGDTGCLGFLCFKAGMTHVLAKDLNKNSPTHNMDVHVPATILECPPLSVFGTRAYIKGYGGLEVLTDIYYDKLAKDLSRSMQIPKEIKTAEQMKKVEDNISDIVKFTLLVHTQPKKSGIGKKKPDIMELGVGGDVATQWDYCKKMLGGEIRVGDIFNESDFLDVIAVTKGKGFQGPVKRWGIKIQKRKAKRGGHMRHVGSIGGWTPAAIRWLAPMAGQMGYHNRTENNKLLIKISDKTDEINPKGGFVGYGLIKSDFILIKGSIPGPRKRTVALRKALRKHNKAATVAIEYISLDSKQGT